MGILHHDLETRSALDLPKVGAWRYAAHSSTAVRCLAYAVDDSPVQLWKPGDPVPAEFSDPNHCLAAHNASFERAIALHILGPQHGFPIVPIKRWRCTMAAALACALPSKLEKVADVLGLTHRKDAEGGRLMKRMAKPQADGTFDEDPERLQRLYDYCIRDVEVERELYHRLPPLSDAEQELWALDAEINARGFFTDGALLEAAARIAADVHQATETELAQITTGAVTGTSQIAKLQAWLAGRGCTVKDVAKGTLKAALRRKDLDPAARRAIELRLGAAFDTKADTMIERRDGDGRIRGTLQYHGAGTGRWAARGVQVQNFTRDPGDVDAKIAAIMAGHMNGYEHPLGAIADAARGAICAAPGHRLMAGDFSGIESRGLAWIAEEPSKLTQWRKFDETGDPKEEPYAILGAACSLPADKARGSGKTFDLAFGYQGGERAYAAATYEGDPATRADIERYKVTWRNRHPETVRFWKSIEVAARRAVKNPGTAFPVKRISFCRNGDFLELTLPSKRVIRYPFPEIITGRYDNDCVSFMDTANKAKGRWAPCNFGHGAYGGLWCENIVSGLARDLLSAAMQRLEAAGYPVILTVHDEIVCEVPNGFGSLEEFKALFTALPDWAEGMPIAVKVRESPRLSKPADATVVPVDADVDGGDADEDVTDTVASVPFMITNAMKQKLELHFSPEEIRKMTPQQAQAFLAKQPAAEPPPFNITLEDIETAFEQPREALGKANGHDKSGNGFDRDYPHGEHRGGHTIATYIYQDHRSNNHTKIEKKAPRGCVRAQYPQSFWVDGQWVQKKPPGWMQIPYRLPELLAAPPGTDVFIPEGMKDAESLRALGLIATTNAEGATPLKAKVGKWVPELNRWFHGVKRALILEDNDEPGRKFAREKAAALTNIVPDIRIVSFPDVPEGEDVTWWLEHGHTKEELLVRCEAAPRDNVVVLQSVRASEVGMRAVEWLWQGRFAIGKLGLICGLPDEGKSTLLSYIAARITGPDRFSWPENEGVAPRGKVIMLTGEDDAADTLVPRLKAAGADLESVVIINMVKDRNKAGQPCERMFSLVDDLPLLRRKVEELGDVRVIEIDPVSAYLGRAGEVDAFRDSDVRAVLTPLVCLASELQIALIAIMHFNKKTDVTNALLRISNSLAFGGVARHVFSITNDEENNRKLMARAKNNIAAKGDNQTLAFRFETREVGNDPKTGAVIRAPAVVFQPGYVDVSATEALSAVNANSSPGAKDTAKEWLDAFLAAGAMSATEVNEAAKAEMISERTLRRAKSDLGVRTFKQDGHWFWKLPGGSKA